MDLEPIQNLTRTAVNEYLGFIEALASKCPGLKFALQHPILRSVKPWYNKYHSSIYKCDGIKTMELQNLSKSDTQEETTQYFENDRYT
jgi:hypothetical protein